MIKKYNNCKNLAGEIIKNARENKGMNKTELSIKLELHGIYISRNELLSMEKNELMIKDFELIAIAKILNIDLNITKDYIE